LFYGGELLFFGAAVALGGKEVVWPNFDTVFWATGRASGL